MWILFPKIRNEGCARKYGAANIPRLLRWDISTTLAQKLWLWIKRPRRLFATHLSYTRKATKHCKVSANILSATTSLQKMERESTFLARPLSFQIRFTTDTFEPIVAKKLFDQVQEVMKRRSRPRHKQKNEPQAYCGLLSCASCGMQITGEYRVKTQLNGTQHFYTYYHCTKKSKTLKCPEPCIRQESLDAQISSLLQKVSLPQDWADYLNGRLEKDKVKSAQSVSAFVEKNEKRIRDITAKLQRLLDGYLDQDVDKDIYRAEKSKLLSDKN